jgi:hypothetical protein
MPVTHAAPYSPPAGLKTKALALADFLHTNEAALTASSKPAAFADGSTYEDQPNGIRAFPQGVEVQMSGEGVAHVSATQGLFSAFPKFMDAGGVVFPAINVGTHGLTYSPTVIDTDNGDIYWGNLASTSLVGPIQVPQAAQITTPLSPDDAQFVQETIDQKLIGQNHM